MRWLSGLMIGGGCLIQAAYAHADEPAQHPHPGIWTMTEVGEEVSPDDLGKKCLTSPSVTFGDGLVVGYKRLEKLTDRFYETEFLLKCTVADDVETCLPLDEAGVETDDPPFLSTISLEGERLTMCELDPGTKDKVEDGCFVMLPCDPAFFDLKLSDYRLVIDVEKRPVVK